ncbi:RING finger protein 145-like [Orbicella faveolata]|uniref:RING finger protein 145-like n=1 Tax=Orbicella faveolata TaxID=48498 RepID=UPI0009E45E95|nr:RING finger protein 145-like [Orbicella faveolata]
MEIENLSSSVKIFYFRNENVILRVPFCFILQLVTYFDKIAKESKEEDTKTWYEIAALISGLIGATGLLANLSYLQKCFVWLIEEVVLLAAFVAIITYTPSDAKKDHSRNNSSLDSSSYMYLDGIYGYSVLYAQVFIAVSIAITPRKWAVVSAKQTVAMFIIFPVVIQLLTLPFVKASSILRDICLVYLAFASVIQMYKACLGLLQLLQDFPGMIKNTFRILITFGWLDLFVYHWKRINLGQVLMVAWVIKFSAIFSVILTRTFSITVAMSGGLVLCFDSLQDVAGASIVVGVMANVILDIISIIIKGNLERPREDRHQELWNDSVSFFLLCVQVGIVNLPKQERLMRIGLVMFVTISLFLQSAYELTEPALMSLGATYTGVFNSKHLNTLVVCAVILVLPGYMIIVLCQMFTFDAWLFVIISSNLVTIVQVMCSLVIYALFVSNVHSESQVRDLDDYVYYINAGSKVFEFLVAVVVLGYTAWATLNGEWNYIGALVISMHAYFNVYKRAQEGWKNFLLRRNAVKRLNSLQWATEEQLQQLNDVCCICYEALDRAKVTKCNHYFHSLCLRKWLYVQDKCPMCHADILPQD